jgi:23S rRNA (uracil1939-C5)-methyltransferase
MDDLFEVRIHSLAYGGDALGRLPDGRVVFVPYALPGEVVKLRIVDEKPRHALAELVEVLQASPERVTPRCLHFGTCGGCHYQHMSYTAQLKAKASILREQLERIGGLQQLPEIEIVPSPSQWNYRNTVQFHVTREGKLSYQKARSNQSFAIQECHLPEAPINQLWPQIDIEPLPGLKRISLRAGQDEELMVVLEGTDMEPVDFSIESLPVSVVQLDDHGGTVLAGSEHISMEILGREFTVSAGSFFQVNRLQAAVMASYLLEKLPFSAQQTVVDAYCGVGLFSAFMAAPVKRLVGIEISPDACEDYTTNLDDYGNVELYEAPVEDVLGSVNFDADILVLDPPRAGLGKVTVQGVLEQGARQVAYVSCDPATLARDIKLLAAGGYRLDSVTLFDMFPQTYHIESISLWKKIIDHRRDERVTITPVQR